ncbi:hypothetical protein BH20GEM2_BH20GEM2_11800 [soil metagenome]
MADYERSTVLPIPDVFRKAEEILPVRADLARTREGRHAVTYSGGEGTVTLDAHRHGTATVVTAVTDQLRTSKLDVEVRHLLNQLPYQWGDATRE